jgi:hypothetical protein
LCYLIFNKMSLNLNKFNGKTLSDLRDERGRRRIQHGFTHWTCTLFTSANNFIWAVQVSHLYLPLRRSADHYAPHLVGVSYKGIKQWDFWQFVVQNFFRSILSPTFRRLTYSSIIKERSWERILSLWFVITKASISDKILMSSKYYIFWDVKECSLVNVYRRFRRTNCYHH